MTKLLRVIATAFVALILLAGPGRAGAQSFVPGTEDVPLMPGLAADAETETVFDTPAGRIVEATAHGAVAEPAVRAFYAEALTALGWQAAGGGAYRRGGETLKLTIRAAAEDATEVTFRLAPAAQGAGGSN